MKTFLPLQILKNFLFCSLFVFIVSCSSVTPTVKRTTAARPTESVVWTPDFRSDSLKNSYRVVLKTPDNSITGICILKKNGDEWRGTLMNEMGAKAFDFIVTDEKCELLNVISMMDKWYIKKTVAADLYYLFNVDNPKASFQKKLERFEQDGNLVVNYKKKQILVEPDGSVLLMNNRHNLQYELRRMVEIDPDKVIL
ncbi:MAG: hypothetical protein LBV74_00380 [Tannerella sp.]|nr:hypothetical protein [Tannerella sp.]